MDSRKWFKATIKPKTEKKKSTKQEKAATDVPEGATEESLPERSEKSQADEAVKTGKEEASTEDQSNTPSSPTTPLQQESKEQEEKEPEPLLPCPRINSHMVVVGNTLYLFGGVYETSHREVTLNDFYTLNLHRMDTFNCLKESDLPGNVTAVYFSYISRVAW